MTLDPFYPILSDAKWVARLVPLGIRTVQLRIKGLTEDQTRAQIIAAQAVCTAHACQLIVNDYWRLAISCGVNAVHLGQEDLADADIEAIRATGMALGVSTHDGNELDKALQVEPDYIALGPVFDTSSKTVAWAPQGIDRVAEWRAKVPAEILLVAIGGITVHSASQVFVAGADAVAVIGDVLGAPDPEAQVRQWIEATNTRRT